MANLFRCGGGRSEASYQNLMDQLIEETATGAIASFTDGANNIPAKEIICHINPTETGTGEKSPQNPYVFGGFTEADLTRAGENIFNKDVGEFGVFYNSSGIITANQAGFIGDYIPVQKGSTVKIRIFNYETFYSCSIVEFNEQKEFLNRIQFTTSRLPNEMTGTLQENTRFICFQIAKPSGDTISQTDLNEGQIVVSYQSPTTYKPYITPVIFNVPFGQTVYGGTLNVTTGVLTINRAREVFDLSDAISQTVVTNYKRCLFSLSSKPVVSNKQKCNIANYLFDFSSDTNHFYCNDSNNSLYLFISKDITELSNIEVVYPLATERTIQLTPTEIKTLLGANNFYHDCNGDIDVTYRANGALYVQEHPITRGLMAARPTEQIQEQEEQQEEKEINKSEDNER